MGRWKRRYEGGGAGGVGEGLGDEGWMESVESLGGEEIPESARRGRVGKKK